MPIDIEKLSLLLHDEIKNHKSSARVSSIYQIPAKNKVSERYTSALFQLAVESGKIDEVENDLKIFYSTIFSNKEVFSFFSRSFIERKSKISIIDKVFRGNVTDESFNFLCILVERNVIYLLSNILDEYASLKNAHYNIVKVHVQSAFPINDTKPIIEAARALAGKDVDVDITVNTDLIGGITVEIDGILHDYSVRMTLNNISKRLQDTDIDDTIQFSL